MDPATEEFFGRPENVDGAFDVDHPAADADRVHLDSPDPILAEAFGRPGGATASLQRPDDDNPADLPASAPVDPWRDPNAPARLGGTALSIPDRGPLPPARRLGVREVLFGGYVSPKALGILALLALLLGAFAGMIGGMFGGFGQSLTSQRTTLVQGGEEMPEGQVAQVAAAVLPSVVTIQVLLGNGGATGSGVVIDGDGFIVTNNHVISQAVDAPDARVQVSFVDGTQADARIVGRDTKTDLAVLRVDVDNLTVAQLGQSDNVRVGDDVIAVGSPLGLDATVTRGIVSALNRPVRLEGLDTSGVIDGVQTDASINPGNSGGPLVDASGRVIGINTMIFSGSGGSVGLGFAIPIDQVTRVAQGLIRDGVVHHPDLGISARSVVNNATAGAEVANVRADSPAQQAGIVEGDVIVQVGDRTITSADEFDVAVQNGEIGQAMTVTVLREGRRVDFTVTPVSD